MHVHFVIHEHYEPPGAYETWARNHNHRVTYTHLHRDDHLPKSVSDIDILIVMGGPQNPDMTLEACAHFDAKAEQALILKAIQSEKAVIGVCLGSQLIGEALGARYQHSPEVEVGKFLITLSRIGLSHPLFSHFGQSLEVGHWHNDMPGLTPEANVIAHSEGCPRQIVAYSELVFGFQCHMELTKEVVAMLIQNDDLDTLSAHRYVDTPDELLSHSYEEMNEKLHQFLDKLEERYRSNLTLSIVSEETISD